MLRIQSASIYQIMDGPLSARSQATGFFLSLFSSVLTPYYHHRGLLLIYETMKPPKFKNIGKIDGSLVNQDKATVLGGLETGI
jgi:hypothetical protein